MSAQVLLSHGYALDKNAPISIQVADDKIQGFDLIAQGWTNTDSPIFTIIDKQANQLNHAACLLDTSTSLVRSLTFPH